MKASLLATLIPCALLAACNQADSPSEAASEAGKYGEGAAATDPAGDGTAAPAADTTAVTPATPSEAIRNGTVMPVTPDSPSQPGTGEAPADTPDRQQD